MFIKLTAMSTADGGKGRALYVNTDRVNLIAAHTRFKGSTICFDGDDEIPVVETPDQIMGLLNGPQIQGAPL